MWLANKKSSRCNDPLQLCMCSILGRFCGTFKLSQPQISQRLTKDTLQPPCMPGNVEAAIFFGAQDPGFQRPACRAEEQQGA